MTDEQGLAGVTEEEIAEVTAKLVRWSTTLTEREQAALASILKQAAGNDDTRGHIIIVGGYELARAEVVRRGVLAGVSSPEQLPPIGSPSILFGPKDWLL
jgi:hypothetical protein